MRFACRFGFAFALLFSGLALGQEESWQDKFRRGIALHDLGRYDEAIAVYREILAAEPENPHANYELAYSLERSGKTEECAKVGKRALKFAKEARVELFAVTGNCYDISGKPKKAVKVYAKGVKEFPRDSNLAYNFALTQASLERYREARELLKIALIERPFHASSYRLLAIVYTPGSYPIPALLAALRFLALEPASERAPEIAKLAHRLLAGKVREKSEGNVEVTVHEAPTDEGDFTIMATMVSLLSATRFMEENKSKSENELLVMQVEGLLGALAEDEALVKPGSFVSDRLVLPLVEIHRAGLAEALTYRAFSSLGLEGSQAWLDSHPQEKAALEKLLRQGG